jgi:hypothetical protein
VTGSLQCAELEGITTVLLHTGEDDFNALACTVLDGNPDTSGYRLAPPPPHPRRSTLFTPI